MDHQKLYKKIEDNIDRMIKLSRFFSKVGLGKVFNRFIPICNIDNTLPPDLPYPRLRELCLLDTFDMFSPVYDDPQKIKKVTAWFNKYGMTEVWGGLKKYENYEAAIVKGIKK